MLASCKLRYRVLLIIMLGLPSIGATQSDSKDIYGWIETVKVSEQGLRLKAKLDTGAATSSLDAKNIRRFRRGKKRLVRFSLQDPESGDELTLERPLVRVVRIKRHDGKHQRRPVIELDVCLGELVRSVEFSLIDRAQFIYPVLLGRSALQQYAVVDPELTFTRKPDCR